MPSGKQAGRRRGAASVIVLLRCRNCGRDAGVLPAHPASMRGLVHCMWCNGADLRMYALADAGDNRSGKGDKYELKCVKSGRTRRRRKGSGSRLPAAAAAVLRMSDRCAQCPHRRDVHVSGSGRCGHIAAGSGHAGAGERCGCRRFAAEAGGRAGGRGA